jgi:hypothetical protein
MDAIPGVGAVNATSAASAATTSSLQDAINQALLAAAGLGFSIVGGQIMEQADELQEIGE